MSVDLKPLGEQVIVVTGATSGNGLAIVRRAAKAGAAIVAVARNESALRDLASELGRNGTRIATCVADVADRSAVERAAGMAIERFGGFDSWVNNAGVGTYGTLEDVPLEDHRRLFDVNYFGTLHGVLVAAEHLRTRGGAIVNVGSILGDRAIVEQGPYCATKHAVEALTETLRMELEREGAGISVTLVKPGAIDTPYPEHARNYMGTTPRLPPPLYVPDVVADAVLFACAHPRRTIYAGGGGYLASLAARMAPRITDRIMELIGAPMQQKPGDPIDPSRADNLYQPREDALRGSQDVAARKHSLAVQVQKLPPVVALTGLAGLVVSGVALAVKAGRRR